jgi:flagellar P-ring protein precursor FlgI
MMVLAEIVFLATVFTASAQQNVRIKDVATISGLEDVQLFGYGLVVGLAGTGDRTQTIFTEQTVHNMLKNMGVELPDRQMHIRNVAAVMVTGNLKPFKRRGTRFDVTVSSLGDATGLTGGTLILTPLQGSDGVIYGSAQGPLSTGGYDVNNNGMARMQKNHTLVSRIPDGAIVQKEFVFNDFGKFELSLSLFSPDFTSAKAMAEAINAQYTGKYTLPIARPEDAATVSLNFGVIARDSLRNPVGMVEFISAVENLTFDVTMPARVVINERSGTIVAGGNVRISEIAVTHGGVKVEIVNIPEVVQPMPFSAGQTASIANPQTVVEEKSAEMVVLNGTTTVSDLAHALNSLGVNPRDVIAILQAIKEAGALQAQLVIM